MPHFWIWFHNPPLGPSNLQPLIHFGLEDQEPMRRVVFSVACFCGLWSTASAQSVPPPSESGIACGLVPSKCQQRALPVQVYYAAAWPR